MRRARLVPLVLCCLPLAGVSCGQPDAAPDRVEQVGRTEHALIWPQVNRLTAPTLVAFARFGGSVSIAGNRLIVGAPTGGDILGQPGTTDSRPGQAFVFDRAGAGPWTLNATVIATDRADWDEFGSAAALEGDRAVVGAAGDNNHTGSAYVFQRQSNGSWLQVWKLLASDAGVGWYYGTSLGLSGDRIVVAAYKSDVGGNDVGSAYVYERLANGTWPQAARLAPSDGKVADKFGINVRISGDYVISGSFNEDTKGANAGAAYIYERQANGTWPEVQKIIGSDTIAGDLFGVSVSIDGTRALVGARNHDAGASNAGATYVFERQTNGTWTEVAKLRASDADIDDGFGANVANAGNQLIVGANGDDQAGPQAGAAYVFVRTGTTWTEERKIVAIPAEAQGGFGLPVAISGNQAVVGSVFDGDEFGAAFVYEGVAPIAIADPCTEDQRCGSGQCADGICCNADCGTPCESCRGSATGLADGTCGVIPAGQDPDNECIDPPPDSCGPDGLCDGNRACRAFTPISTPCGATTCTGGVQVGLSCTGGGECNGDPRDCLPYACDVDGKFCLQSCTAHVDCASSAFCNTTSSECVPKLPPGTGCDEGAQCSSGSCVDGVCCNSTCAGQCEACDVAGKVGSCSAVTGEPHGSRTACANDGDECAGTCDGQNRASCTYPGVATACGTATCTDGVANPLVCNGGGSCVAGDPKTCSPYACGATECKTACEGKDSDCAFGYICEEGQCVPTPEGRCSDDLRDALDPQGAFVKSCSPYFCANGRCAESCTAATDCQDGFACDRGSSVCVKATKATASEDSGCGCRVAATPSRVPQTSFAIGALVALAFGLRRRRRAA